MADIKKIRVGEESYDITASRLEGNVVEDYGWAPNISFDEHNVNINSVDAYVNISGDLTTTSSISSGHEIRASADIYAQNSKKVATEEWVLANASGSSSGNTFETIQIGEGAPMFISEGSIFRDADLTLETTGDITLTNNGSYPIKLYGSQLLFNDQPVGGGGNTFETIQIGDYTSISAGEILSADNHLSLYGDGIGLYQTASLRNTYIELESYDSEIEAYPITIQAKDAPIKIYGSELLFNDQPVIGTVSSLTAGESNEYYAHVHVGTDYVRFGDDELFGYINSFYVAAGSIEMFTKNDINFRGYGGKDFTININNKPLATQEWVTAQIQAALSNN